MAPLDDAVGALLKELDELGGRQRYRGLLH